MVKFTEMGKTGRYIRPGIEGKGVTEFSFGDL